MATSSLRDFQILVQRYVQNLGKQAQLRKEAAQLNKLAKADAASILEYMSEKGLVQCNGEGWCLKVLEKKRLPPLSGKYVVQVAQDVLNWTDEEKEAFVKTIDETRQKACQYQSCLTKRALKDAGSANVSTKTTTSTTSGAPPSSQEIHSLSSALDQMYS